MKKAIVGALAGVMLLSGCSLSIGSKPKDEQPTEEQTTSAPAPQPTTQAPTPTSPSSKPADTGVSGDVTPPGTTVHGPAVLPFVNYDDREAVFSHEVVAIDLAPESDVAAIKEKVPQIEGMNVYYIRINSKYVSGENLEFDAFYTNFKVPDANGNRMQELSLIGWDNCESNSIPAGGGLDGAVIENCLAAVAPAGGNQPGGAMWAPYDTPYEDAPVIIAMK